MHDVDGVDEQANDDRRRRQQDVVDESRRLGEPGAPAELRQVNARQDTHQRLGVGRPRRAAPTAVAVGRLACQLQYREPEAREGPVPGQGNDELGDTQVEVEAGAPPPLIAR